MITRDLDFWTYVKSSQRTIYGIKAYPDLWDHFLGPDNVDNMVSEAKRLLVTTYYSGEHKRFNFELYVKMKNYQHHILEGLKEHRHVGIDPRSQVRHLIQCIKITEIDAVKYQIVATASLGTYYGGCVFL